MMNRVIRVGVLKAGCVGTLPLLEVLLDERADRPDIDIRVVGTGPKLGPEQCREAAELMKNLNVDLIIFVGPAQTTPGPTETRKTLKATGKPVIVISDSPAKKAAEEMEGAGLGYIIVEADSMIGARREFLDPAEMVLYNSDVMKVLAVTGALSLIVEEVGKVIDAIKRNQKPELPRLIIDAKRATEAAGFSNAYAKAKAIAAYQMAKQVSVITTEACFKIQEREDYVPLVAAAHEIMRAAAKLADEAREIEKTSDSVLRRPHMKDGTLGTKRTLTSKPERTEQPTKPT